MVLLPCLTFGMTINSSGEILNPAHLASGSGVPQPPPLASPSVSRQIARPPQHDTLERSENFESHRISEASSNGFCR